jgi:hypothetical protein
MADDEEFWVKTHLSWVITSASLVPETISKQLGISPSRSFKKGDPGPGPSGWPKYPWGLWAWSTEVMPTNEVENHVERLLEVFEPKADQISDFLADPKFTVTIRIDWDANYPTGGYRLPALTVQRLSKLCNHVDIAFIVRVEDQS